MPRAITLFKCALLLSLFLMQVLRAETIELVANLNTSIDNSYQGSPYAFIEHSNKLYFLAREDEGGQKLFVLGGDGKNIKMVELLYDSKPITHIYKVTAYQDKLYF